MSYPKILRTLLLVGILLGFLIPFIIADGGNAYAQGFHIYIPFYNMFFPFITGKNFVFRILVEILLGVYILLALREPKYRPKASWVMWALGAFVLWIGLATLTSVDPTKSFWSNFERMEGYITILHLFAYFIIVGAVVGVENWWDRLFKFSIAASVVMGLCAVFQLLGWIDISSQSGSRVDTTFGNAIYLAVYMLFNIYLTLFMLMRQRRSSLAQVIYGVALVLQMTTLFYTQTRGAFLGVIGGLIVTALFTAWRARAHEWRNLRKISLWGLCALALIVILVFSVRNTTFVKNSPTLHRMTTISLSDTTTHARIFYIWPMALKGSVDSPKASLLGYGQENFSFVFNKFYMPEMYNQEQWFDRAHNQFLDWLIVGGFPALVLYLSLFVLMAWTIIRSDVLSVPEQAILLGLLAGYAFNNLTVFDDLMSSIYFFLLLALVHGLSRKELPRFMFLSKPVGDRGVAVVAPFVLVGVVFGVWFLNIPAIARAQNLVTAISTQIATQNSQGQLVGTPKEPKQRLAEFTVALGRGVWPGTPLGNQEVTEQLIQFASTLAPSTSVDSSTKSDIFDLAESAGKNILAARPHDARLELFVGEFYNSFGLYPQALQYLNEALKDSPKKQTAQFEIGVVDINSGNLKDAVPVLKAAFENETNFKDARILYAAALFYNGLGKEADQLLIDGPKDEGFGSVLVDDPRLLQVYTNTKQFDRVIAIWKQRIVADPKNAQLHAGLAQVYFAQGDKANTILELQEAAKADATLADQVKTLIKQIQDGTLKPGQ